MLSRRVSLGIVFSLIATLAVGFFTTSAGAVAPPSPDPRVWLDKLLVEYRRLGLPLPTKDAQLVRFQTSGGGVSNGKVTPHSIPSHSSERKKRTPTYRTERHSGRFRKYLAK